MTRMIRWAATAAFVAASAAMVFAQDQAPPPGRQNRPGAQGQPANPNPAPQGRKPGPAQKPPLNNELNSPAYIQQMFDTLAVMEAEKFLPLTPEQYPVFVQKLRRVQEARAQLNRRRLKATNELRGLAGPQARQDVPESAIDAKLKELAAVELEGQGAIQKALDDLNVGLTVRQRARFRLLEENVERRKVDFLTRVRQGGGFEGFPE